MPTPNPEYNPDWQELHDHHHDERNRIDVEKDCIQQRLNALHETDLADDAPAIVALDDEWNALDEQWRESHEICLSCLDTYCFETLQDLARWRLDVFDPQKSAKNKILHDIDFEAFSTLDEVQEALSRAREVAELHAAIEQGSKPIGRPDGLDIFEDIGSNEIASAWFEIDIRDLNPSGYYPQGGHIRTLVTIDKRQDEFHICFMQDPDQKRGGMALLYEIPKLATHSLRSLRDLDVKPSPPESESDLDLKSSGGLSEASRKVSRLIRGSDIQPHQLSFYYHKRPTKYSDETFLRVQMGYQHEKFQDDPSYHGYEVIPKKIQSSYNAAKNVTPSTDGQMRIKPSGND